MRHVGLGGRLPLILPEVGEVDQRPAKQVLEKDEGLVHVLGDHHKVKLLEEIRHCHISWGPLLSPAYFKKLRHTSFLHIALTLGGASPTFPTQEKSFKIVVICYDTIGFILAGIQLVAEIIKPF